MKIIGLTGSVGMGKSATADFFKKTGVPVFDADLCVHDLYKGKAVAPMANLFPDAIINQSVSREVLSKIILNQPDALQKIEAIIHPLVRDEREKFIAQCRKENHRFILLDIPLLFEKQQHRLCNIVCVVSASDSIQRARVLARPGMTQEKFEAILKKQMPDHEKRKHSHYVILTSSFEKVEREVGDLLRAL